MGVPGLTFRLNSEFRIHFSKYAELTRTGLYLRNLSTVYHRMPEMPTTQLATVGLPTTQLATEEPPNDAPTYTVGTNHTGPRTCPMRCFRCKFRPCALGGTSTTDSTTELHALPHLCRSAANNLPCHQELLAKPDMKDNDDANGGQGGSDGNDGSDKGSEMKSAEIFELDAAKQLH